MAERSLVARMKGAAALNIDTFEEVEHDGTATGQAAAVVAMVAVASAIGLSGQGLIGMIGGVATAIFGWLVWSGVTYIIGDKVFGGTATWGELLRTIGFAHAPGVLLVFAFVPVLGSFLAIAVYVWILWAVVIAVRQALDFTTGKALATGFLGWLVILVCRSLLGMM